MKKSNDARLRRQFCCTSWIGFHNSAVAPLLRASVIVLRHWDPPRKGVKPGGDKQTGKRVFSGAVGEVAAPACRSGWRAAAAAARTPLLVLAAAELALTCSLSSGSLAPASAGTGGLSLREQHTTPRGRTSWPANWTTEHLPTPVCGHKQTLVLVFLKV